MVIHPWLKYRSGRWRYPPISNSEGLRIFSSFILVWLHFGLRLRPRVYMKRHVISVIGALMLLGTLPCLGNTPVTPEKVNARLNQPRPNLAVLSFNEANVKAKLNGLGLSISGMFITEMRNHSNFMVLERSKVAEVLGNKENTPLGITENQIRLLESRYKTEVVVTGEVAYWDNAIEIDARLISAHTGEVVAATFGRSSGDSDLRKVVGDIAKSLEKKYLHQWMGTLIVACQPVEAEVYLNGEFVGKANAKTTLRIDDLLEGLYPLELIAPGYKTWNDTLAVTPKSVMTLNASLSPLPGTLYVNSQPVGAEVFLDGKAMGNTPVELKNVTEGEHRLKLDLANFYSWEEKVFVNSGQSTQSNALLRIRMGLLDITSQPPGASVTLNGNFFGKTPLRIDKVEPGKVALQISAPGYRPFREAYSVKPNDTIQIREELKLRTGWLTVVSTPRDVSVRLISKDSNKLLGATPVIKEILNVGDYNVVLEKENYYSKTIAIQINTDEEARVEIALDRKPGHLAIQTEPNTEVLVDGAFKGYTPTPSLDLKEGVYTVQLNSLQGNTTDKITIQADQETTLKQNFTKNKAYLMGTFLFIGALGALIAL
jgi:TolB-like protein